MTNQTGTVSATVNDVSFGSGDFAGYSVNDSETNLFVMLLVGSLCKYSFVFTLVIYINTYCHFWPKYS